MTLPFLRHRIFKPLLFVACLLPLGWIIWSIVINTASPDPAKSLVDATGIWALRLLWASLLMTPLRHITRDNGWIRLRRLLGLFAFFYATLHVFAYWFLLFGAEWGMIWDELAKRPYIMVGMAAYVLLVPLAVTSTQGWQRRLRQRWVYLHKMVYLVAILALTHFTWQEKLGLQATMVYALALLLLLGIRVFFYRKIPTSRHPDNNAEGCPW